MPQFTLNVRYRLQTRDIDGTSEIAYRPEKWNPEKAAVIICDMWDTHHCISTTRRAGEMAPRMNKVIGGIRESGTLIIHAPSNCMAFYDGTPQRILAQEAPKADAEFRFGWNGWKQPREIRQLEETPLPIEITDTGLCSCETPEPCCTYGPRRWVRQIDTIEIAYEDAVTDDGQEVYNLLQERSIDTILMVGGATNICILARPFAIRQLVYLGKHPLLCRDLTVSHHRYSEGYNGPQKLDHSLSLEPSGMKG